MAAVSPGSMSAPWCPPSANVDLMPKNAEVLGLAALIAYSLSREVARVQDGRFVPLDEQDVTKWDQALMQRGASYLARAKVLDQLGRFQLEAAIQAVHAERWVTGETDWVALTQLHFGLSHIAPTIGAAVGHAAALGKAMGPEQGLKALYRIDAKIRAGFGPAEATRAHFLSELGQTQAAVAAYTRAISLTSEDPLRRYLETKCAALTADLISRAEEAFL